MYTKIIVLGFGVLTIALSFLAMKLGAILTTFYRVFGVVGGPVVGVFCLGMLTRKTNARGAYVGLLSGLAIGLWIGIGAQVYRPPLDVPPVTTSGCFAGLNTTMNTTSFLINTTFTTVLSTTAIPAAKTYEGIALYRLSFLWYSGVCFLVTYIVGLVFSVIFPGDHVSDTVDPRLLFHFTTCYKTKGKRYLFKDRNRKEERVGDQELPGVYRDERSKTELLNDTAI